MDTRAMAYYTVIYENRSIHRAAEKLYISQQGLSSILRSLEKEYGTLFFQRTPQGLRPTPAGDCFYQEARRMLKELSTVRREIRDISSGKQEITVACSFGAMHVLYGKIRQFYIKYPDINVHWVEYTDVEADRKLADQEVDLAFLIEGGDMDARPLRDLELRHLFSGRIMVLVYEGHPYYDRDQIRMEDLACENLIFEGSQFHIHQKIIDACLAHGFYPEIKAETVEINLCYTLCQMREGLGIVVDVVSDLYRQEDVHAIPLVEEGLTWDVALARKRSVHMRKSVQAFWDFLV